MEKFALTSAIIEANERIKLFKSERLQRIHIYLINN